MSYRRGFYKINRRIIPQFSTHICQFYPTKRFPVIGILKRILMFGFILVVTLACQKKPENIIMISIDALRQSAVKAYNSEAPFLNTLDLFTNQSVVFQHAYSTASWTLPAHGSLFTGLHPDRHGAVDRRLRLSTSILTLAGQLRKAGFYTVGFTDGGYMARPSGLGRGFDQYDDWTNPLIPWKGPDLPRNGKRNEKMAGLNLFDRGITFINGHKKSDKNFFLFLHTFVVHDYYGLHPWALDRLPPYPDGDIDHYKACITGKEKCPSGDWERLKALYDAELYRMDEGLTRLLDALDRKGLRDSTLIIFLSDHGEGFDPDRNRIHHGGRLHQDQINIPLMIYGPHIKPRISQTPISLVDIMPTVLDVCGIPVPKGLDGKSFVDVLRGEKDTQLKVIYAMEHFHLWDHGERYNVPLPQDKPISIAVIREDDWYIRDKNGIEIYNMINDPLQINNLSSNSLLKSELERLAEMRSVYRPSAQAAKPDKETIDHLKSLGYIE